MRRILIFLIPVFFLCGCGANGVDYVTPNKKDLPKSYEITHDFLEVTGKFHSIVRRVSIDAYQKGLIEKSLAKNKILPALNQYDQIHDKARGELKIWFRAVKEGKKYTMKSYLEGLSVRLRDKTKEIFKLVADETGIYVPKTLPERIYKLFNKMKGNLS